MEKPQLITKGEQLSAEAGVPENLHRYFLTALPRLNHACKLFGLFQRPLGDVLEIGPFYGYLPFFLRPHTSSYTVIEGDDPAVYPLKPLYQRFDIDLRFLDFSDLFGPMIGAPHALPIPDASYDTIVCWETMEHFTFNPVKFVRELRRILKPGGRAYITVPNRASLNNLRSLLTGGGEKAQVDSYYKFEDAGPNGRKCFYGFHWREYASPEMERLFALAKFKIESCGTFTVYRSHAHISLPRRLARIIGGLVVRIFPRFGAYVHLTAEKPAQE
jgi:SAM-dependent methyltransferase